MNLRSRAPRALALSLLLLAASAAGLVRAADLDQLPPPAPRAIVAPAPGVWLDPRCRIVPEPQLDLYGNVAGYRPMAVCFSQGVLADSFYPFYPYPY
ncbi:MAG TPA: hypothetical protein VEQ35_02270 [Beijerinckia sp.]|nr:hypothetical protein [Beijerinckia sp.]